MYNCIRKIGVGKINGWTNEYILWLENVSQGKFHLFKSSKKEVWERESEGEMEILTTAFHRLSPGRPLLMLPQHGHGEWGAAQSRASGTRSLQQTTLVLGGGGAGMAQHQTTLWSVCTSLVFRDHSSHSKVNEVFPNSRLISVVMVVTILMKRWWCSELWSIVFFR